MTSTAEGSLDPEPRNEQAESIQVLRPLLPDAQRLLSYLRRIDEGRTYTNWGPLGSELEARLAGHCRLADGCVTLASSGTSALVGAILATAGRAAASGPLAIVPAYTFVATALATELCAFRPYLADVDADSWLLQAEALEKHPSLGQVGLVIPVAAFGQAVPQAPWLDFHRRTGISVVIDGGASFEAVAADPARFLGEIPVALSFHATKSFATAEGGCVMTTDAHVSRRVREALNFGFFETRDCRSASTNGKMSEYHAAVGLAELDGWSEKLEAFRRVATTYQRCLDAFGLGDRVLVAPSVAGCYALFRCWHAEETARVLDSLARSNIESRFWYGCGLHRQPYYAGVLRDALPFTESIAPLVIALPVAPDLPEPAIERVAAALRRGAMAQG